MKTLIREMAFPDIALPALEIACASSMGRYRPSDILAEIERGSMQVWLAKDGDALEGFLLTQILDFPGYKTLRLLCCQSVSVDAVEFMGTIREYLPLLSVIEDWGRELGCAYSEIEAPETWELLLRGTDYVRGHVLLAKRL
jgi:hypothetical protein